MKTTSESIPDEEPRGAATAYSVLMSIYHAERPAQLGECLQSLARQTLVPTQVVVVEDGPVPEALVRVLEQWRGTLPIQRLALSAHRGLGPALNAGLAACRSEIVGRMDADDIAEPHRFDAQVRWLSRRPDVHVLGAQIAEFGAGSAPRAVRAVPLDAAGIRARALYRNPMNHMTVCYRRDAILGIGGYGDVPGLEDYELWVRGLRANLTFCNMPDVLVRARTSSAFYARRRGLTYARVEWALGGIKARSELWPRWKVGAVTAARAIVRLLPAGPLGHLYRLFLRRPR